MSERNLLEMSEEELRELDQKLRQEGYKIEAAQQAAFERHVAPVREKKREVKHKRDAIATVLSLRGQVRTPAQREVLGQLLSIGEEG